MLSIAFQLNHSQNTSRLFSLKKGLYLHSFILPLFVALISEKFQAYNIIGMNRYTKHPIHVYGKNFQTKLEQYLSRCHNVIDELLKGDVLTLICYVYQPHMDNLLNSISLAENGKGQVQAATINRHRSEDGGGGRSQMNIDCEKGEGWSDKNS